ncbi:hypothetical protein DL96DRAFT_1603629 [Flagelloscypha sp. PMI_526]|nr:hypothetical protein DL96DRAFT_1603629 [Flagelloscypha sp. PMI_526]
MKFTTTSFLISTIVLISVNAIPQQSPPITLAPPPEGTTSVSEIPTTSISETGILTNPSGVLPPPPITTPSSSPPTTISDSSSVSVTGSATTEATSTTPAPSLTLPSTSSSAVATSSSQPNDGVGNAKDAADSLDLIVAFLATIFWTLA